MTRNRIAASLVVMVTLGGCAGPLLSERISATAEADEGLAHGSYCLPKIVQQVTVVQDEPTVAASMTTKSDSKIGDFTSTIAYVQPIILPDPSHLYRLGFLESATSDDNITVEYDGYDDDEGKDHHAANYLATCLLSRIATTTEDKSPQIVRDLASTALRVASGSPKAGVTRTGAGAPTTRVISLMIDVGMATMRAEQDRLNAAIAAAGMGVSVSIRPLQIGSASAAARENERAEGIFFLTPALYVLTLHRGPNPDKDAPIAETTFYSSNGVRPQFIAIDRSAFVLRKTTINFARGFPTKINTNKPSEVAGFMSIPLDVTEAIFSVPVESWTQKAKVSDQEGKYLQNQVNVIKRQQELIKEQNKLIELLQKAPGAKTATVPVETVPDGDSSAPPEE